MIRGANFYQDRTIPGLTLRESIPVPTHFQKTSPLITETDGKRVVDLKNWFRTGQVEMKSERDTWGDWRGVELHLSSPQAELSSGLVMDSAYDFFDLLQIPRRHFHMHIVSEFPSLTFLEQKNEAEKQIAALRITEWFARINTIFELLSIQHANDPLHTRERQQGYRVITEFDNQRDYVGLFKHVLKLGKKDGRFPKSDFKIAYVGVRGPGTYQGNFWGIEVRTIHPSIPEGLQRNVLDLLEKNFHEENWNITQSEMTEWLQNLKLEKTQDAFMFIQWDQTATALWQPTARFTQSVLDVAQLPGHLDIRNEQSVFRTLHAEGKFRSTQMLFHDWCTHPLIKNDASLCHRVISAQLQALASLKQRYPTSTSTLRFDPRPELRKFVQESGILDRWIESLVW
ncbi:MAG: hypothetical protein EOP09_11770 [Proteobacteria bacterium]|nr:MAG: hypothetical protein EOP09_11770 [Pseudomonadota bacterium]